MTKFIYSIIVLLNIMSTSLICGSLDKITDKVGDTVGTGVGIFTKYAFLARLKEFILKWGVIILIVILAIILLVIIFKKLKKK